VQLCYPYHEVLCTEWTKLFLDGEEDVCIDTSTRSVYVIHRETLSTMPTKTSTTRTIDAADAAGGGTHVQRETVLQSGAIQGPNRPHVHAERPSRAASQAFVIKLGEI